MDGGCCVVYTLHMELTRYQRRWADKGLATKLAEFQVRMGISERDLLKLLLETTPKLAASLKVHKQRQLAQSTGLNLPDVLPSASNQEREFGQS